MLYVLSFLLICFGVLTALVIWMLGIMALRPIVVKKLGFTRFFAMLPLVGFLYGNVATMMTVEDMARDESMRAKKVIKQAVMVWAGFLTIFVIIYFLGGFKDFVS